jgi:hypothetical protein
LIQNVVGKAAGLSAAKLAIGFFMVAPCVLWADQPSTSRPGGFKFDTTISREVLENYLSRSVTMEGLLNGRGDLKDNIRMLKGEGAKYIGRALCLWGAEKDFVNNVERARKQIPEVLAADPEMVLEACVFEIVGQRVNQVAVPDWVFAAFGLPVTNRNFVYEDMIYPQGQRRSMGQGQVPDESRLETRMWFYYQAASYIDIGCEGIHFGQVEIMNRNDPDNARWAELLGMVRRYATSHAYGRLAARWQPAAGFQRVPAARHGDARETDGSHFESGLLGWSLWEKQGRTHFQRLDVRPFAVPGGTRQLRRQPASGATGWSE